jgi:hypothetical protein
MVIRVRNTPLHILNSITVKIGAVIMGYSHWSDTSYDQLSKQRASKPAQQIFTQTSSIDARLNPLNVQMRESRDSADHPNSNALVVAFDVTGSMGKIPEQFARQKLGKLMQLLLDGKYIEDPQVLFAAIGDGYSDRAPLQIAQFESGLEMDQWLTKIWLEKNGGGQKKESYGLAHYFAAKHTSTDCFEKRQKKGYLFTMGDEMSWDVPPEHVQRTFGYTPKDSLSMPQVIKVAEEKYNVFHIVIFQGSNGSDHEVHKFWSGLLQDRSLVLSNAEAVCELIAVTVGLMEGAFTLDVAMQELANRGTSETIRNCVRAALLPLAKKLSK